MNAKGRKGDGVRKNRDGMVTGRRRDGDGTATITAQNRYLHCNYFKTKISFLTLVQDLIRIKSLS